MPVVASNRIGTERGERWEVTYYGSSFITDHAGAIAAQAPRTGEAIVTATFDLDAIRAYRTAWGVFRDRRPEHVRAVDDAGRPALAIAVQFFASCPPAVADLTAAELRACGATHTRELKLGVLFEVRSKRPIARACGRVLRAAFSCRSAISQLQRPKPLYEGVAAIDWAQHVVPSGTLAIEFGGSSAGIKHTHFGALKTKDAIGRPVA